MNGRPAEPGAERASMRRAAQQFVRTVLPAVAFDDPDGLFELALARRDTSLRSMLDRIDPTVRVPGLPRFNGRWALSGGSWRHLPSTEVVEPSAWEAVAISLPMVAERDGRYALIARCDRGVRYFASLVAPDRDGLVLAERYSDPKDQRATGAPTHTRTHRALKSQALSVFLDACAEVLANSAVPPSLVPDRLPRPVRRANIRFAHGVLREVAFAAGRDLEHLRGPRAAELLARAWAEQGDPPMVSLRAVVDHLGVWPLAAGEVAPPVGWELLVVAMPGPIEPGEAWFGAIATHARTSARFRPLVRFFTGDRTWDSADGSPRGLLVEWGNPPLVVPRPRQVQPWDGAFTTDEFADAVRERLPTRAT